MAAPDPDAVRALEGFFVRYFHDEPIDDEAILTALKTLQDRRRERYELSQAFTDVLEADVEPGFMTELVRRYANRAATSDEQARDFVERMRESTALDDVLEPPDDA
jgi:hypothetical protein